jgi:hypothetical protein
MGPACLVPVGIMIGNETVGAKRRPPLATLN